MTSNATATYTTVGTNRYEVAITQGFTSGSGTVGIRTTNAADVIQKITVNYNSSHTLNTIILNISDNNSTSTTAAIERIDIVSPSNTHLDISVIDITGNLGTSSGVTSIEAGQIRNISIGGNWYANVDVDDTAASASLPLTSVTVGGDWLSGGLYNNAQDVGAIDVGGVISGPSFDPVEIWAKTSIFSITADSISEARLGSETTIYSGTSVIRRIETRSGDYISTASTTIDNLRELIVDGDFDAEITVLEDMWSGYIYNIGGEFSASAVLALPAAGLLEQIIINANNTSDLWLGDVEVGSATLAPNYTDLSVTLGGGAVGAAPFNFHQFTGPLPGSRADLDCNPFHTEVLYVGECEEVESLEEVVIDHYGHVFVNGSGPHFRVEFRSDALPASWTDVTNLFEVDTTKTSTANGGSNRAAYLKPASGNTTAFNSSGWFRFRPITGKVKSANVTGTPDVVYESSITSGDLGSGSGTQYDWYQFRVRLSLCDGLTIFEGDQVNAADIAAWADQPFEVNCDGQICEQDLADMLSAYNN